MREGKWGRETNQLPFFEATGSQALLKIFAFLNGLGRIKRDHRNFLELLDMKIPVCVGREREREY